MELLNICRTCLIRTNDLINIHSETVNQCKIADLLMECTSLKINSGDGLLCKICPNCVEILITFARFRTLCLLSDLILRNCTEDSDITQYLQEARNNRFKKYYNNKLTNSFESEFFFDFNYKNLFKKTEVILLSEKSQTNILDKELTKLNSEKSEFLIDTECEFSSEVDNMKDESSDIERPLSLQCANFSGISDKNHERNNKKYRLKSSKLYKRVLSKKINDSTYKNKICSKESKKKLYICYVCGIKTLCLSKHLLTHREVRDYKCDKCSKLFSNPYALRSHEAVHKPGQKHVCDKCGRACASKTTLVRHIRNIHNPTRQFECSVCSKRFQRSYYLKWHKKRVHSGEKQYACEHCPEQFASIIKFRAHKMKEHNLKPTKSFKCDRCNLTFFENYLLIAHEKTPEHAAGGKFECTKCREHFQKQYLYLKHMKLKHPEIEIQPIITEQFKCDVCNKIYYTKKNLRRHEKTHIKEKTLKCQFCDKAFSLNKHLEWHTRLHTGERPYKCNECNKAYVSAKQLNRHINKKHKTNDS